MLSLFQELDRRSIEQPPLLPPQEEIEQLYAYASELTSDITSVEVPDNATSKQIRDILKTFINQYDIVCDKPYSHSAVVTYEPCNELNVVNVYQLEKIQNTYLFELLVRAIQVCPGFNFLHEFEFLEEESFEMICMEEDEETEQLFVTAIQNLKSTKTATTFFGDYTHEVQSELEGTDLVHYIADLWTNQIPEHLRTCVKELMVVVAEINNHKEVCDPLFDDETDFARNLTEFGVFTFFTNGVVEEEEIVLEYISEIITNTMNEDSAAQKVQCENLPIIKRHVDLVTRYNEILGTIDAFLEEQ